MMGGYFYIMATKRYGTIYTGVTSDLARSVFEHKNDLIRGFTSRYRVHDLVYCERHERIERAIQRERKMKHWKRAWKAELVDGMNPDWGDLYSTLI